MKKNQKLRTPRILDMDIDKRPEAIPPADGIFTWAWLQDVDPIMYKNETTDNWRNPIEPISLSSNKNKSSKPYTKHC